MPRWSAERRDVPIARDVRRLASVFRVLRKHATGASHAPRAFRRSAPPSLGGGGAARDYGAAGAAKQTAGGALAV
jgi:hypothetical protein